MIVEGIVTTRDKDGNVNIAPMGPIVLGNTINWQEIILRPFSSSRTLANLMNTIEGVFHITDDVLLFVQGVVGEWSNGHPQLEPSRIVQTPRLADCCRYYEFNVVEFNLDCEPTRVRTAVVHNDEVRPFLGFNRARHAVIEAAIFASRIGILPDKVVREEFARLRPIVDKTGEKSELLAFNILQGYLERKLPARWLPDS